MARAWRRNVVKCSRSVAIVGILVVGVLLVVDRYDRLDEFMPEQLARGDFSADDDTADDVVPQPPVSPSVARPAQRRTAGAPAPPGAPRKQQQQQRQKEQRQKQQQQRRRRPEQKQRRPEQQQQQQQQQQQAQADVGEAAPQQSQATGEMPPASPDVEPAPGDAQAQVPEPPAEKQVGEEPLAQAEEAQGASNAGEEQQAAGAPLKATDGRETWHLRQGLQTWILRVATFQQVDALDHLRLWFKRAPTPVVKAKLDELLRQDTSSGWGTCAIEDESCNCPSGKIRYGHVERTWLPKNGQTSLWCSLGTFGGHDVAVGMLKECQCWQALGGSAGVADLQELASTAEEDSHATRSLWARIVSAIAPAPTSRPPEPPPPDHPPSGSLWGLVGVVAHWVEAEASEEQLRAAARVYRWMENTRNPSKVAVAISGAAAAKALCPDGKAPDTHRCPSDGGATCRAGCHRGPLMASATKRSPPVPRAELCAGDTVLEPVWSCDRASSRLPRDGHPHAQAQTILDKATQAMCEDQRMRPQLAIYLQCDFVDTYRRWTSDDSEWLDEAYVTYVGGAKNSQYQWQATNLVRSVDVFSSRPIVVVVFGDDFVPPASWQVLHNVIVFRMHPMLTGVSFNFNKLRSMIATRVVVGIQLDTDQLIAPGMDRMFEGTRREITDRYPWLMLPVHWMSREGKRPEPYWEYAFRGWDGVRTMRWGHAHPTWTYWAVPFISDLLLERFSASHARQNVDFKVWDLAKARDIGLLAVLNQSKRTKRSARMAPFMMEDEDMFNVGLWRDSAAKDWCKFDLEWGLFKDRLQIGDNVYWDSKWYPNGLPIVFISMHNTKQFEQTDWLLSLLAKCDKERPELSCPPYKHAPRYCEAGSTDERRFRRNPAKYVSTLCCCFEPRQKTTVFWGGMWFRLTDEIPKRVASMRKDRTCLIP